MLHLGPGDLFHCNGARHAFRVDDELAAADADHCEDWVVAKKQDWASEGGVRGRRATDDSDGLVVDEVGAETEARGQVHDP